MMEIMKITIEEAIQQLEFDRAMIRFDATTGEEISLEILKTGNMDNYLTYLADEIAIEALKEVQQYRKIGTVEECREAVETQKAKIPFEETVEIGRNINEICSCPNCGCDLTDYKKSYWLISRNTYCYNCGQAIKWVKEDME